VVTNGSGSEITRLPDVSILATITNVVKAKGGKSGHIVTAVDPEELPESIFDLGFECYGDHPDSITVSMVVWRRNNNMSPTIGSVVRLEKLELRKGKGWRAQKITIPD